MDKAVLFLCVLELVYIGVATHLILETRHAIRQGYFRHTFVTGWLFRDTDLYGQPVLFWLLFALHTVGALLFLSMTALFGWAIASAFFSAP